MRENNLTGLLFFCILSIDKSTVMRIYAVYRWRIEGDLIRWFPCWLRAITFTEEG